MSFAASSIRSHGPELQLRGQGENDGVTRSAAGRAYLRHRRAQRVSPRRLGAQGLGAQGLGAQGLGATLAALGLKIEVDGMGLHTVLPR